MVKKSTLASLAAVLVSVAAEPEITDIKMVSVDTGSSDTHGVYDATFIEVSIKATETGTCWFKMPADVVTFNQDTPYSFEYGSVNRDDDDFKISLTFDSLPKDGVAQFGVYTRFQFPYQTGHEEPKSESFKISSSSGEFTANVNHKELPTDQISVHSLLTSSQIIYDVYVPADMITNTTTLVAKSADGRIFDGSIVGVYSVQSPPTFHETSSDSSIYSGMDYTWQDFCTDSETKIVYSGQELETAKWVLFKFFASVPADLQYYNQVIDVTIGEVTETITTHTYSRYYPGFIEAPSYKRDGSGSGTNGNQVTSYSSSQASAAAQISTSDIQASTAAQTSSSESQATTASQTSSSETQTSSAAQTSHSESQTAASAQTSSVKLHSAAVSSTPYSGYFNSTRSVSSTAHVFSTTVITTCPTCEVKATTVGVSTATVTIDDVVTEYLTYCPLETQATMVISKGTTYAPSVVITEVESNLFTAYTTYCPIETKTTSTVSEISSTPTVVVSKGTTYAPSVVTSEAKSGFTTYTTYSPYTTASDKATGYNSTSTSTTHSVYEGSANLMKTSFAAVFFGLLAFWM
ncbi:LAME_0D00188g1_1 [Lachancea meyersii CBS 8951]|uniref:LAME_0D00188g1_1 n=1 Tax=Lachancea meyersii CBS 8951 TaxID=1266667 RepID=A0A1G4J5X6_9SACH|nr:LAME_0D00188g1_1 [Lachancea meyersii CBS 8951]